VSTGGSAKAIEAAGVAVKKVEDLTGFPEMLDGECSVTCYMCVTCYVPKLPDGKVARIEAAGVAVKKVEDLTGFLEMLDGDCFTTCQMYMLCDKFIKKTAKHIML
jgi:AICAR transformylase/IMP cyclohydrolase PurH